MTDYLSIKNTEWYEDRKKILEQLERFRKTLLPLYKQCLYGNEWQADRKLKQIYKLKREIDNE